MRGTGRGMTAFRLAVQSPPPILKTLQPTKRVESNFATPTQAHLQLMHDIERRVVSTLRILVDRGASSEVFVCDHDGNTPLHQSVQNWRGCNHGMDFEVGTEVLRFLF